MWSLTLPKDFKTKSQLEAEQRQLKVKLEEEQEQKDAERERWEKEQEHYDYLFESLPPDEQVQSHGSEIDISSNVPNLKNYP